MTKSNKASDKTEELKPCFDLEVLKDDIADMMGDKSGGNVLPHQVLAIKLTLEYLEGKGILNAHHSPVAPEDARKALDAINSAMKKTINPSGGPKAIDDYCNRQFCCFAALSTNIETIRRALKELI